MLGAINFLKVALLNISKVIIYSCLKKSLLR